MRIDCTLRSLSQEQLDDLYDWILVHSYDEAIRRAAAPAPDGLGLRLHRTTLSRFFKTEQRKRHAEELAQLAVIDDTAPEIVNLIKSARIDFAHAVYDLASAPDRQDFDRLENALHRLDRSSIDREMIALKKDEIGLSRERVQVYRLTAEFSIARELLKSAPEFMDILKRDDLDDENKVWLARDRTFGPSPLAPFPRNDADRHPPQSTCGSSRREEALNSEPTPPKHLAAPDQSTQTETPSPTSSSRGDTTLREANDTTGELNGGGLGKPNAQNPSEPAVPAESAISNLKSEIESSVIEPSPFATHSVTLRHDHASTPEAPNPRSERREEVAEFSPNGSTGPSAIETPDVKTSVVNSTEPESNSALCTPASDSEAFIPQPSTFILTDPSLPSIVEPSASATHSVTLRHDHASTPEAPNPRSERREEVAEFSPNGSTGPSAIETSNVKTSVDHPTEPAGTSQSVVH